MYRKIPRLTGYFPYIWFCIRKPNSVFLPAFGGNGIYLGLILLLSSSDSDPNTRSGNTVLHTSKDLAVSPPTLPSGLTPIRVPFTFARGVSARTSWLAPDGYYPLLSRFLTKCVRTFLIRQIADVTIRYRTNYIIPNRSIIDKCNYLICAGKNQALAPDFFY